ncbi:MAG: NifX-associated nitrogen fixation protein [Gammaproteobacteria bacterium]|nr:NifX-associated nitrogen fixation protein [Gammaproteobacteria bacterium]
MSAIDAQDPVLETQFVWQMVRQMRAIDTYGSYDNDSSATILEPFILTPEKRREIPVIGDPDEILVARVKGFYNAIAAMIEAECGQMAVPLLNLSHEGFGRVIITVGKLVVLDKTLRDVHRFGFASLSKMKDEADKLLSVALEIIGKHPQAAGM